MAENFPMAPRDTGEVAGPTPIILPPGAQSRVGAPVVASGNNAPRPTTLQATPMAPYVPVEYQRQAPTERASPEELDRQRLSDFFFGMANSQSPSFFGAIGQAGQALSAADRQRDTAAREDRRTQAEENYRSAQIAVQNAQIALERDPNSPANIARLATAQAQLTSAEASLINARRGPQAPQAQTTLVETSAGPAVLNMQTNTLSPLPAGVITPQMQQRRDTLIQTINQNANTHARQGLADAQRTNPTLGLDENARNREYQRLYDNYMLTQRPLLERLGAPLPPAPAPGGGGNVRTFDPTGTRELNR